jgi:hypothetical protein
MANDSHKFKEGNLGKPKGAQNKTTKAARELFVSIMEGQQGYIEESLEKVRKKDPAKYLEVLSKFYPYFIPKKVELESPEGIQINITRKVIK